MTIQPEDEQLTALLENDPGGPISMVNLLKFKEFAEYADGSDSQLSGMEAYMRYGVAVTKMINKLGGEVAFVGQAKTLVIGDGDLQWDMVSIVRYPSVAAFIAMTESDEYQDIHLHRDAGLANQVLVQCQ